MFGFCSILCFILHVCFPALKSGWVCYVIEALCLDTLALLANIEVGPPGKVAVSKETREKWERAELTSCYCLWLGMPQMNMMHDM